MGFVVTNSDVYHLTERFDSAGSSVCGFDYTPESASVVHQQPDADFRLCQRCEAVTDGGR